MRQPGVVPVEQADEAGGVACIHHKGELGRLIRHFCLVSEAKLDVLASGELWMDGLFSVEAQFKAGFGEDL